MRSDAGRYLKAKEKRASLVTHLVAMNLATARDIAISASNEFACPYWTWTRGHDQEAFAW